MYRMYESLLLLANDVKETRNAAGNVFGNSTPGSTLSTWTGASEHLVIRVRACLDTVKRMAKDVMTI